MNAFSEKITDFYKRHETHAAIAFFVLGFVFDVATLSRIDDVFTIGQQLLYLVVLTVLIACEITEEFRPLQLPNAFRKPWQYRELIIHFIFGSLLSVYTLFFLKSASFGSSFIFLVLLIILMLANEIERFQKMGPYMRTGLLSLCYTCFFSYVIPVGLGFVGFIPFFLSLAISGLVVFLFYFYLVRNLPANKTPSPSAETAVTRLKETKTDLTQLETAAETQTAPTTLQTEITSLEPQDSHIRDLGSAFQQALVSMLEKLPTKEVLKRTVLIPGLSIQALFLLLYLAQAIPPVPLSAQYMGIYHHLEKAEGRYILFYERPWWKFWQNGAQTFLARPGDRVYVFARVFAPSRFNDQVRVRFLYDDPKRGWQPSDSIPFSISGGRDEGFRGFAFKQNFQPGHWRVQLETSDGREISRIGFDIESHPAAEERDFKQDIF